MKRRSRLMPCLLLSVSAQGYGQEQGDLNGNAVAEAESRFLFINMIEFLGEFETESGEWISPDILGNDAFADLDADNGDEANPDPRADSRVLSATGNDDEE